MNTRNTLFIENDNLIIGKITAAELVKKFGTPLYVMDADYIAEVCDAFSETMKTSYPRGGAVAYASKAFASVATSKIIQKHGLWFDSVSGGELYLLNKAGVDMKHVVFHGNAKTEKEINEALDLNIKYFVIDSYGEIERLDKAAGERGMKQEVLVRVNPGVSAHTYEAVQTAAPLSKFGFGIDGDALDTVKYICGKKNLAFKGLHFHIGSQIYDHSSYDTAIDITLDFVKKLNASGIEVETLDLGGGYGIYYTDEDPKFTPKRYAYTLKNICGKLLSDCAAKDIDAPFLLVEPGRCIVGEAGVTLYTVNAVKDFPDVKKYVAIDGGMFENPRHALYGSRYSAVVANKASKPKDDVVTLAGKCCESGDIISKDIPLQKAELGDIIAVFSTGAYNYSMASNYNQNAVPPVVLVCGDKADYIVKPQSYEDLIRRDVTPEWL
jgi:diaminopimelate decarboxylase